MEKKKFSYFDLTIYALIIGIVCYMFYLDAHTKKPVIDKKKESIKVEEKGPAIEDPMILARREASTTIDVRGAWDVKEKIAGEDEINYEVVFSGNKSGGTFTSSTNKKGEYTVSTSYLKWTPSFGGRDFGGEIVGDQVYGNIIKRGLDIGGWSAKRKISTTTNEQTNNN
ncbi:MAG: hypothetical protein WCO84_01680 [bacterium]